MPIQNLPQYVKFVRGTPNAFTNLTNKDPDTLYFISENNATTGLLYLGDKLISGSVSTSDLGTVILNNLGGGDILVYDEIQQAWVNTSPTDIITVMQGATASTNGTSGLVPVPVAGDELKFLRGDGTWAAPTPLIDSSIFVTNNNDELTLKGFSNASVGQLPAKSDTGDLIWISPSDLDVDFSEINERINILHNTVQGLITTKLQRKIVPNTRAIDVTAADADKYIYMVPNNDSANNNQYSEYMVIDGTLELIGNNYEGDLTGYVTTTVFDAAVGDLEDFITNVQKDLHDNYVLLSKYNNEVGDLTQLLLSQNNGPTLVHQVNDLTVRLMWTNLSDNDG